EKVSITQAVPVLRAPQPQVLAQPVQVAAAGGRVVPEPIRDAGKAPLLPRMTGQIILDDRAGRTPELRQQPAPMPLAQLLRRQLIPILRRVKPEVRAQPAQVAPAVGGQIPKAVRCLLP